MNGRNRSILARFGQAAIVAMLALCAASAPASAQTVTIHPDGIVKSGVATVTGTFSAPVGTPVRMEVRVQQFRHGQVIASAFTDLGPIIADGSTQSWTATMFAPSGFKPGHAQVTVRLIETEYLGDGDGSEVLLAIAGATVQLHPR